MGLGHVTFGHGRVSVKPVIPDGPFAEFCFICTQAPCTSWGPQPLTITPPEEKPLLSLLPSEAVESSLKPILTPSQGTVHLK